MSTKPIGGWAVLRSVNLEAASVATIRWSDIQLGNVGEWLAGLGAIAAVMFAALAARSAKEASETAQRSTDLAAESVREAARTRLDDHAPRLAVVIKPFADAAEWVPARSRMPAGDESPMWNQPRQPLPDRLTADEHSPGLMSFKTSGFIANEGTSTAEVRLGPHARWSTTFELPFNFGSQPGGTVLSLGGQVDQGPDGGLLLAPGDVVGFEWYAGHTIGEWVRAAQWVDSSVRNPHGRLVLQISAFDMPRQIADDVYITGKGEPLQPSTILGEWVVDVNRIKAHVVGAQRAYIALGESPANPSEDWLWAAPSS